MEEVKSLNERVKELELFKDTLLEFGHTTFNLKITEFERYLVSPGFQPSVAPTPSAPPPA